MLLLTLTLPAPLHARSEAVPSALRALQTGDNLAAATGLEEVLTAGLEEKFISQDPAYSQRLRGNLLSGEVSALKLHHFVNAVLRPFEIPPSAPSELLADGAYYRPRGVPMDPEAAVAIRAMAEDLIRRSTPNDEVRGRALAAVDTLLARLNAEAVPGRPMRDLSDNEVVEMMIELVRVATGVQDPYDQVKRESNEAALLNLPLMQRVVASSSNPLGTAIALGIVGNALDFADPEQRARLERGDVKLETQIEKAELLPFRVDHRAEFSAALRRPTRSPLPVPQPPSVLFLADNAGEIVYDLPLIKLLLDQGRPVVVAGKSLPHANDMTVQDLRNFFADSRVRGYLGEEGARSLLGVIASGTCMTGCDLRRATPEFVKEWRGVAVVYAKGQGMIETLRYASVGRDIFHAVLVKQPKHFREALDSLTPLLLQPGDALFLHTPSPLGQAGMEENTALQNWLVRADEMLSFLAGFVGSGVQGGGRITVTFQGPLSAETGTFTPKVDRRAAIFQLLPNIGVDLADPRSMWTVSENSGSPLAWEIRIRPSDAELDETLGPDLLLPDAEFHPFRGQLEVSSQPFDAPENDEAAFMGALGNALKVLRKGDEYLCVGYSHSNQPPREIRPDQIFAAQLQKPSELPAAALVARKRVLHRAPLMERLGALVHHENGRKHLVWNAIHIDPDGERRPMVFIQPAPPLAVPGVPAAKPEVRVREAVSHDRGLLAESLENSPLAEAIAQREAVRLRDHLISRRIALVATNEADEVVGGLLAVRIRAAQAENDFPKTMIALWSAHDKKGEVLVPFMVWSSAEHGRAEIARQLINWARDWAQRNGIQKVLTFSPLPGAWKVRDRPFETAEEVRAYIESEAGQRDPTVRLHLDNGAKLNLDKHRPLIKADTADERSREVRVSFEYPVSLPQGEAASSEAGLEETPHAEANGHSGWVRRWDRFTREARRVFNEFHGADWAETNGQIPADVRAGIQPLYELIHVDLPQTRELLGNGLAEQAQAKIEKQALELNAAIRRVTHLPKKLGGAQPGPAHRLLRLKVASFKAYRQALWGLERGARGWVRDHREAFEAARETEMQAALLKTDLVSRQYPDGPIQMLVDDFNRRGARILLLGDPEFSRLNNPGYGEWLKEVVERLIQEAGLKRLVLPGNPRVIGHLQLFIRDWIGLNTSDFWEYLREYHPDSEMVRRDPEVDIHVAAASLPQHWLPAFRAAVQRGIPVVGFDPREYLDRKGLSGDPTLPLHGGKTEEEMALRLIAEAEAAGPEGKVLVLADPGDLAGLRRRITEEGGLNVVSVWVGVGETVPPLYAAELPMAAVEDTSTEPLSRLSLTSDPSALSRKVGEVDRLIYLRAPPAPAAPVPMGPAPAEFPAIPHESKTLHRFSSLNDFLVSYGSSLEQGGPLALSRLRAIEGLRDRFAREKIAHDVWVVRDRPRPEPLAVKVYVQARFPEEQAEWESVVRRAFVPHSDRWEETVFSVGPYPVSGTLATSPQIVIQQVGATLAGVPHRDAAVLAFNTLEEAERFLNPSLVYAASQTLALYTKTVGPFEFVVDIPGPKGETLHVIVGRREIDTSV